MGQSLEKDFIKCFSLIGSKCPYREHLLIVFTTLAIPKTALNQAKDFKDEIHF